MPWYRVEDCNRENIERLGGRLHQKVNGRYVSILLHNDKLFAIDSCCFHASGPVGEGPIKDIEDIPTIRCMWHNMIFALDTGERVTQEVLLPGEERGQSHNPVSMSFPLRPQGTTGRITRSGESVQRVHNVREVDYSDKGIERERWPVEIELSENYPFEVRSDVVACNPQYAKMCMTIQQRKIDGPAMTSQMTGGANNGMGEVGGAGNSGGGGGTGEVKNSFARTLLHTLQTSATVSGGNEPEYSPNSSSNSNSSSSASPFSNSGNSPSGFGYSNALEDMKGASTTLSSSGNVDNNNNNNGNPNQERRQSRIDPALMARFDNAAREKNASMNLSNEDVLKMNGDLLPEHDNNNNNNEESDSDNNNNNNNDVFDEEGEDLSCSPPRNNLGGGTPAGKNYIGGKNFSNNNGMSDNNNTDADVNFESATASQRSVESSSGNGITMREESSNSISSNQQYQYSNNSSSQATTPVAQLNFGGGVSRAASTSTSSGARNLALEDDDDDDDSLPPPGAISGSPPGGLPPPPPGNPRAPTPPPER